MEPKDIPPALLKIIDDKTINGDLVAVNTSLGINANIEPLDEFGAFKEYGIWSESASYIIPKAIDYNLKNILSDQTKIWSN